MVPPPRTPLRVDRLRALNLPSAVEVGLDGWGRPTWVREAGTADAAGAAEPHDRQGGEDGLRGTAGGAEEGRGGPARVEKRGGEGPPGRRRVDAVVEEWRIDDEWWRTPIHRRYVEVVLEGGAHVVLFEDLVSGEWFMQRP